MPYIDGEFDPGPARIRVALNPCPIEPSHGELIAYYIGNVRRGPNRQWVIACRREACSWFIVGSQGEAFRQRRKP